MKSLNKKTIDYSVKDSIEIVTNKEIIVYKNGEIYKCYKLSESKNLTDKEINNLFYFFDKYSIYEVSKESINKMNSEEEKKSNSSKKEDYYYEDKMNKTYKPNKKIKKEIKKNVKINSTTTKKINTYSIKPKYEKALVTNEKKYVKVTKTIDKICPLNKRGRSSCKNSFTVLNYEIPQRESRTTIKTEIFKDGKLVAEQTKEKESGKVKNFRSYSPNINDITDYLGHTRRKMKLNSFKNNVENAPVFPLSKSIEVNEYFPRKNRESKFIKIFSCKEKPKKYIKYV